MNRLRQFLATKRVRVVIVVTIVALTLGVFGYYLATKPETLQALLDLNAETLLFLTVAYSFTIAINGFVLWTSLKLLKKPVSYAENIALTGYSSIVNFFGPLQSGPGFRAAYLKTRHGVKVKEFFYATVIFYGFFALFNGGIIAIGVLAKFQQEYSSVLAGGLLIAAALLCTAIAHQRHVREKIRQVNLTNAYFWFIGLGAVLLSLATCLAYFIELSHVDASVTPLQSLLYAAAANLALFVSLTPGAIGFRESFLLLSQQLHGITTDTIVAASVIDRAFYVVFLLVLFVMLLVFGIRGRLQRQMNKG